MKIGNGIIGFGMIMVAVVSFGLFFSWGTAEYGVSDPNFGQYNISETYEVLVAEDLEDLTEATFTQTTFWGWITSTTSLVVKNILGMGRWLGAFLGFFTNIMGIIPIPPQITAILFAVFTMIITIAVLNALLGGRVS